MADTTRELKYSDALAEATVQAMEEDENVFLFGVDVDDAKGIFGTTLAPNKRFGSPRVMVTPLSENSLTGMAVGAALSGIRPIMVHARDDFFLLTMDQIVNHAAKWRFMFGAQQKVPLVIRGIIGRGWGQGAQHSQSLQAMFTHVPGLKVIMPSNAYDAKGLMLAAIRDDNPVICIEHRKLYEQKMAVPEEPYAIPLGKANRIKEGKDVTLIAVSQMVLEAIEAAKKLEQEGISAEVIDLRTLKPYDGEMILESAKKTGRVVVADTGWLTCGFSSEISAFVTENVFSSLKGPVKRVALPDFPTPCSWKLEAAYYPDHKNIINAAKELMGKGEKTQKVITGPEAVEFKGPF